MDWHCQTGELAEDCIITHALRPLGDWPESLNHWRANCPLCDAERRLSIQVKNYRPVCNTHCGCDPKAIERAIGGYWPCWTAPGRRRKPVADLELLRAVLADKTLPPGARQLWALRALGIPEAEIRRDLPRSSYYAAIKFLGASPSLGQTRRSQTPKSSPRLGLDARANKSESRINPQVTEPPKAA